MNRHRLLLFSVAALAAPWASPPSARASLVVALDTAGMVQRADHIAVVDVLSTHAAWDDRHERILTTIDLSVVETWKGPLAPASHIRLVQPGGTAGDLTMVVFGMPAFTPGERSLLFLHGPAERATVVGMAQGKRTMIREAATGRWVVHAPDRAGAEFVRAPGSKAAPNPGAAAGGGAAVPPVFDVRVRPLDDVRAEVRDLVLKAQAR